MLAAGTVAAEVEKLVQETSASRALAGNLLPLNNNECFVELESVSTVTIVAAGAKEGAAVAVAFGLVNRCGRNQLYCSFVVTAPRCAAGFVNVELVRGGRADATQKHQQHSVLRVTETLQELPDLSGLPQYFRAFGEPAARPLLQCAVDQLLEQTFGHADVETRRNVTVDVYESPEGGDPAELWRDYGGFVVDDRFRYRELHIEREALLGVLEAARVQGTQDADIRIEKLSKANFDALCEYDQGVSVMNRLDHLEYLFGLYGIAGSVALDGQQQPVGYALSLDDHLLQCYAEDERTASTLLTAHVEQRMPHGKVTMFVRHDGEWITRELLAKAASIRSVRRFHSRIVPGGVKWQHVFAYNVGLHLF